MHHVGNGVQFNDLENGRLFPQINLLEGVLRVAFDLFEAPQVTGICQTIQIDELLDVRLVNNMVNDVRADKTCAAGNEKFHRDMLKEDELGESELTPFKLCIEYQP